MDRVYPGGMFDPESPAGRVSGTIRIAAGILVFETEGGKRLELPLSEVELTDGGTAHRKIFFKHPRHPDHGVFTSERAILKDPQLSATLDTRDRSGDVRRRMRRRRVALWVSLLVLVGLGVGLWVAKNAAVEYVVRRVPAEWEADLGRAAVAGVAAEELHDPESLEMLRQLLAPLLETVRADDPHHFAFEFHIVDDETVNAFAAPGGQIVIYTGLLRKAERPEQLAGVVAHELAHVTRRHGVRAIVHSLGLRILLGVVFSGTDVPSQLVDRGSQLLQLKHSRSQELDADEVGWQYLVSSGIDPRGMEEFFALVSEHDSIERALTLISTHPAPQSRIDELRRRREELGGREFQPLDEDLWRRLRERVVH